MHTLFQIDQNHCRLPENMPLVEVCKELPPRFLIGWYAVFAWYSNKSFTQKQIIKTGFNFKNIYWEQLWWEQHNTINFNRSYNRHFQSIMAAVMWTNIGKEKERMRKTGNLCDCMNRVRYVTYIIDGDTSATQDLNHGMSTY